MRRRPGAVLAPVALVLAVAGAAGCSEDAPAAEQERTAMVEITIEGDSVRPGGERVEVAVGQPVELVVKSDIDGEIHVHSEPEKEMEFEPGTTSRTITFERPGLVDVERHDPDTLIVQLEVR